MELLPVVAGKKLNLDPDPDSYMQIISDPSDPDTQPLLFLFSLWKVTQKVRVPITLLSCSVYRNGS